MPFPLEQWYMEIPPVTRVYLTLVALTSLACTLDIIKPIQLYFNWNLIIYNKEYWRLFTSFLYFGNFSLDFVFHMFFLSRYSRMLEEGSFRGRTADYFWMLTIGVFSFITIIPLFTARSQFLFLSTPLTFMLVYIWARRNPHVRMSFLGILNFSAPYLPWVLLGFTIILNNIWPAGDILGLIIGHVYYFLEDVYPKLFNLPANTHILGAPKFIKKAFDYLMRDAADPNLMDDDEDIDNVDFDSDDDDANIPHASTTIHNEGGYTLDSAHLSDNELNTKSDINKATDENNNNETITNLTEEKKSNLEDSTLNNNNLSTSTNSEGLKKRNFNFMADINTSSEPGGYNWNSESSSSTEKVENKNIENEKKEEIKKDI